MATTATLYPDLQRFPPGTTVKAYKRSNFLPASGPVSGPPQGTQDASATVSSAGQVAFTGLTTGIAYVLYASVSGQDRYATFSTKDTPSSGVTLPIATSDVTGLDAALTAKAPLASPALTGVPTAPTAAQGTNTTQLASTQYVQTEAGLLVPKSLVDAKGDLLVGTADNTVARKAAGANGKGLVADSAQSDGLTYRHQFRPPQKVGRYYNAGPQGAAHNQSNSGQFDLYAMPLAVPQEWAFDRIGIEVQTAGAAGAAARLCVYNDDGNSYPGALLYNCGTVVGDGTTGWKEITGLSMSGKGPLIWLAVEFLGPSGRPTLRCFSSVNDDRIAGAADALTVACSYKLTLGSDSLPDPFTAAAGVSNLAFKVAVRAA